MYYVSLVATYFRLAAQNELEYRVNFWFNLMQSLMELGLAFVGLTVIFSHTDNLGGWQAAELIALVGVYFLMGGVVRTFIRPAMTRFFEDIRKGTLDFTLTKPVDSQVLVSIQKVEIWRLVDVFIAIPIFTLAIIRMGSHIGLFEILTFVGSLFSGMAIIYSFLLLLSTTAFWFVRVENIQEIFVSLWQAGRWPIGIYPFWLRVTLTFLVPVAFATTVPASAISGRITTTTFVGSVALAAALLLLSRWFWRLGIRFYSGASA